MHFREMEKMLLKDGWELKDTKGSHPKSGKVTLARHGGDIDPRTVKLIMKQAGLK